MPKITENFQAGQQWSMLSRNFVPLFSGYFWNDSAAKVFPEYFAGYRLNDLYDRLKEQIEIALLYAQPELEQEGAAEEADRICAGFLNSFQRYSSVFWRMYRRDSMVIRLPRAKKKSYHRILDCLPFMYIAWLIFYIKKKFRIFRESWQNMHMVRPESILIREQRLRLLLLIMVQVW